MYEIKFRLYSTLVLSGAYSEFFFIGKRVCKLAVKSRIADEKGCNESLISGSNVPAQPNFV